MGATGHPVRTLGLALVAWVLVSCTRQAPTPSHSPQDPAAGNDQTFTVYTNSHPHWRFSFEYPAPWTVEHQEHDAWRVRSLGSGRLSIRNPVADLSVPSGPVYATLLVEVLPSMSVGIEQYARIYQRMTQMDTGGYREERAGLLPVPGGSGVLLEEQFEVYGVTVRRLNLFVLHQAVVFQLSATAPAAAWERYRSAFERFIMSFQVLPP